MTDHSTGHVASGDVTLFYRKVGQPGGVPVVILHGGNYYDSLDWLPVAERIGVDREVVVFDQRGMGQSGWSASKNYSNDAVLGDVTAVMDALGWPRAIVLGQSRNAARAVLFGGHFPERTAGVVMADSLPGSGPPPGVGDKPGAGPAVFATVDDLIAKLSNDKGAPAGSPARARLESLAKPVDGGFIVGPRDPDMESPGPRDQPGWVSRYPGRDMWAELGAVTAPTLLLRAARSKSCKPESLDRLRAEFATVEIVELDSGHDLPSGAPDETAAAVLRLARAIDAKDA